MSPSLLSIHGTEVEGEFSQAQKMALSKWASINFYGLNVHGIRGLLIEVVDRECPPTQGGPGCPLLPARCSPTRRCALSGTPRTP